VRNAAAVEDAGMVTTPLPRPAALLAAAIAPGSSAHQRQRELVRASLIARG
jgi:hypothetical protein